MELYIGGSRLTFVTGDRCHSAVTSPRSCDKGDGRVLLDSGAFNDKPEKRLTFEGALSRQLEWENKARQLWADRTFTLHAIASYDYLLIDEVWENGARRKKRWGVDAGWDAVEVSIRAAEYITSRRDILNPRHIVLGCQGATAEQYIQCARELIKLARPGDWFGFGGRCILGRQPKLLQEHYETAIQIVPMLKQAGINHAHIYGVLYEKALAPLAWLCDQYGITLSTDSKRPATDAVHPNPKKAGCRGTDGYSNIAWWRNFVSDIARSKWYANPAVLLKPKQLSLFTAA